MKIQKSSEDYLEAMLIMRERHGYIRSIDVAEHLGVTKPSVSYATRRLRENGYISMDKDGLITLQQPGLEIASRMLTRHRALTDMLVGLGVDRATAEDDACKIEHDISEETFAALCRIAQKK
ncbi:MAG: metal-dependent transcriptional regulator [Clostridia bacterium]|nr:metal-dependent transcriptional regulator [Clostridia bacterium]